MEKQKAGLLAKLRGDRQSTVKTGKTKIEKTKAEIPKAEIPKEKPLSVSSTRELSAGSVGTDTVVQKSEACFTLTKNIMLVHTDERITGGN